MLNLDATLNLEQNDILAINNGKHGLKIMPAYLSSYGKFYTYNAQLNGEVMLATFVRFFAQKVPILRSPFELFVIFFNLY